MKCGSAGAAEQVSQLSLAQVKAKTSGAMLAWAFPAVDLTPQAVSWLLVGRVLLNLKDALRAEVM